MNNLAMLHINSKVDNRCLCVHKVYSIIVTIYRLNLLAISSEKINDTLHYYNEHSMVNICVKTKSFKNNIDSKRLLAGTQNSRVEYTRSLLACNVS